MDNTAQELADLIQQAASAVTLTGPEDVEDLQKLHAQLDAIAQCVGRLSDLPEAIRQQATAASTSAGRLLQALLRHEQDDAEETLRVVSEVVVALQQLNGQIEKGLAGDEVVVAFPAADAGQDIDGQGSSETVATEAAPADVGPAEPKTGAGTPQTAAGGMVIGGDDIEMVNDFIAEAAEHIESIEAGLLNLENAPEDLEAINLVFRGFHTIKGMAGFLNLSEIQRLAHAAENILDLGRKQKLQLLGETMDVVFEAVDLLKQMMQALGRAVSCDGVISPCESLPTTLDRLTACAEGRTTAASAPAAASPPVPPAAAESEGKKPEPARQPEDPAAEPEGGIRMVSGKPMESAAASTSPSRSGEATSKKAVADEKIKVSTARLDSLVNMVGELVIAQSMVYQEAGGVVSQDHDLVRTVSHQGKIVRELQELSMMMRMVPIQGVFQKMARLVRDLSQKSGKRVVFTSEGEDTELDRIVVDQIGDPLVHMVRNSVDHGIESEDERRQAGKDPVGHVHLRAFHQAGSIVIQIQDDGRGLDKERILKKAIDQGLVSPGQELPDSDIYKLIFHAGLSTARQVTDISGRGVGMDVVKKSIDALRGKVDIETELGRGTTFTIRLPLTMAIIEGQIVRIGAAHYVVPIMTIECCLRPTPEQISTIRGRAEMVMVQNELIPMVRLYRLFGVAPDSEVPWESSLVVVGEDGLRGCLMVDEVLGQHQVVIKSLGQGIGHIPGIAGGAIMGDGRISLIIDVPGLLQSAMRQAAP